MVRPPDRDLSGKSEQARAVWSWSIVPICLHGKASGGPLMAPRISTISFLERRRGAQSTWVLSDLGGKSSRIYLKVSLGSGPLHLHCLITWPVIRGERPSP